MENHSHHRHDNWNSPDRTYVLIKIRSLQTYQTKHISVIWSFGENYEV